MKRNTPTYWKALELEKVLSPFHLVSNKPSTAFAFWALHPAVRQLHDSNIHSKPPPPAVPNRGYFFYLYLPSVMNNPSSKQERMPLGQICVQAMLNKTP